MRRKLSVSAALVLVLIGALLTFQITYSFVGQKYQEKLDQIMANQTDFSKLAAVDELVRDQFVGTINDTELMEKTLRGYMQGLGDSGCSYLSKEEFAEYVRSGSGEGMGVGVNVTYLSSLKPMYVYRVFEDSPADKAGILPGDVIDAINGEPVQNMGFAVAKAKLNGAEGGSVALSLRRGEQPLELTVSYASFRVETVSYSMLDQTVGYLRIYSINPLTEGEFKAAVDALVSQGAKSLVYDLRNTVGGDYTTVVKMLDHLIAGKTLARTYSSEKDVSSVLASTDHSVTLPSAVLVNGITSSGAELFAASLRDCSGAILVGETTYGDAAIRTSVKLADLSGLVITTRYFAPPVSESFQGKGLICDVQASLAPGEELSLYTLSYQADSQLQAAVRALTTSQSQ